MLCGGNQAVVADIAAAAYPAPPESIEYYSNPAEALADIPDAPSDRFAEFLEDNRSRTVLVSARGDAAGGLSYLTTKYLMYRHSTVNRLKRGGSYVAVVHRDEIIVEVVDNRSSAEIRSQTSEQLRRALPTVEIGLSSAGTSHGDHSSITVDGVERSLNAPGMNAVVLDRALAVIDRAAFDTGR